MGRSSSITVGIDSVDSAKAAGLRYTTDAKPGIRRRRHGSSFSYLGTDGKPIRDPAELKRIRALVIPPAWTDVWICPDPLGHLQATGRDARGRKQHRYHPRWRAIRDETKYHRLIGFANALEVIRARTAADLRLTGLCRRKVLATVVQLLEKTLIRVGNDEYARHNRSFGLTTLRDGHVDIHGGRLLFSFRGKSGKDHQVKLDDPRLARIVKACRDIPGYELFQYVDEEGKKQTIGSSDVNEYLREMTGQDYTSKDFRTWAGTILAAQFLCALEPCQSEAQAKRNIVSIVESVASRLGNTTAVCRKSYIHPAVLAAYSERTMSSAMTASQRSRRVRWLSNDEIAVLRLLKTVAAERTLGAGRRRSAPSRRRASARRS